MSCNNVVDDTSWKMDLGKFTSVRRRQEGEDWRDLTVSQRRFYHNQNERINEFEAATLLEGNPNSAAADIDNTDSCSNNDNEISSIHLDKRVQWVTKLSLAVNICLLAGKVASAVQSGSLAVISSLVDSGLDLFSGILIWWTSRVMNRRDVLTWPVGKRRLEPLSIVVAASVMGTAALQLLSASIKDLISGDIDVDFDAVTLAVLGTAVASKLMLFIYCKMIARQLEHEGVNGHASVHTLAIDHKNDIVSNTVALSMAYVAAHFWPRADSLGATIISLYILQTWVREGYSQLQSLAGRAPEAGFHQRITWIAANHHPDILLVDTVKAYNVGGGIFLEVDIVLPPDMSLREAHDIGEGLQNKLESLKEVERAFLHLDWEADHRPETEHKTL